MLNHRCKMRGTSRLSVGTAGRPASAWLNVIISVVSRAEVMS
jgi:hypothetical protein